MSWMPCGRSVYPCRAHANVIRPMQVHSPYIVKSIKMVPSCLIFPLQFECSKISSTSTFNQKKNLQRSTMRFTQKSCMYATQELHPQFPSLSGLFCLVHQIFSKLILSWTTSSLSLSLSNLTNSKFPIILWTIQNLFSLVVLTTPTYLFITFWFLGITTIRFWLKGNHTINRLAWKQITGFAAKVAWGTVLYSVLLLNLVS